MRARTLLRRGRGLGLGLGWWCMRDWQGALSDNVQIRLLGYFLHFSEKNIGLLQKSEFIDIVQSRHGQRARHEEDGFTRFVR